MKDPEIRSAGAGEPGGSGQQTPRGRIEKGRKSARGKRASSGFCSGAHGRARGATLSGWPRRARTFRRLGDIAEVGGHRDVATREAVWQRRALVHICTRNLIVFQRSPASDWASTRFVAFGCRWRNRKTENRFSVFRESAHPLKFQSRPFRLPVSFRNSPFGIPSNVTRLASSASLFTGSRHNEWQKAPRASDFEWRTRLRVFPGAIDTLRRVP